MKIQDETEVRVQTVSYVWPCMTCNTPVGVDFRTYGMLRRKKMRGVRCGSCLTPPPRSAALKHKQKGRAA